MKKTLGLLSIASVALAITLTACSVPGDSSTTTVAGTGAPTLNVTSPADNSTYTVSSVLFAGTATAPAGWGDYGVYLKVNGAFVGSGKIGADSFNTNITFTNGTYVFTILAIDSQYVQTEKVIHVTVDTNIHDINAPSVTVDHPTDSETFTDVFEASGTASDDYGVAAVYVSVDSAADFETAAGTTSWTYSPSAILTAGTHTFRVFALDTGGNCSATNSIDFDFVIADVTRPTAVITSPADGGSITNDFVASGTASDDGTLNAVYYQIDGGGFAKASGTSSWTVSSNLSYTAHTLDVFAVDSVGNCSDTNSAAFTLVYPENWNFEYWQGATLSSWFSGSNSTAYETNFDSIAQSSDAYSGTSSAELTWAGAGTKYALIWNSNLITVSPSTAYFYRFYAKAVSGSPQVTIEVKNYTNGGYYTAQYNSVWFSPTTVDWMPVYYVATTPSLATVNGRKFFIEGYKSDTGTVLVDDVFMAPVSDDSTAPTIGITTPASDHFTNAINSSVLVSGTWSDNFAADKVYVGVGSTTNSASVSSDGTWSMNFSTVGYAMGDYTAYVWLKDYNGNLSSVMTGYLNLTNGPSLLMDNGFETTDGWVAFNDRTTNIIAEDGTWRCINMYVSTGSKRTGLYGTGFNTTSDVLISPAYTNPGTLSFWATKSSVNTHTVTIYITTDTNSTWTTVGTVSASDIAAAGTFQQFSFDLSGYPDGDYYIKWAMTQRTGASFYMDDIILTAR